MRLLLSAILVGITQGSSLVANNADCVRDFELLQRKRFEQFEGSLLRSKLDQLEQDFSRAEKHCSDPQLVVVKNKIRASMEQAGSPGPEPETTARSILKQQTDKYISLITVLANSDLSVNDLDREYIGLKQSVVESVCEKLGVNTAICDDVVEAKVGPYYQSVRAQLLERDAQVAQFQLDVDRLIAEMENGTLSPKEANSQYIRMVEMLGKYAVNSHGFSVAARKYHSRVNKRK